MSSFNVVSLVFLCYIFKCLTHTLFSIDTEVLTLLTGLLGSLV